MTDRSNNDKRQRYIQFRFQESLRRYQPPPRKLFKPNQSVCKNCFRKSCESGRQNRIIRFCQTRRIYHATSRERASQFSRKKQAVLSARQKASEHVSDFNCNQNMQSNKQQSKPQKEAHISQINLSFDNKALKNKDESKIKWSINISQTPIKQSLRVDLQKMCKNDQQECMVDEHKQQNNISVCKVKDIDFHIGLVQQLHQKILKEYTKLDNQLVSNNNIQQEKISNQEPYQVLGDNSCQNNIQFQLQIEETVQSAQKAQNKNQKSNLNQQVNQEQKNISIFQMPKLSVKEEKPTKKRLSLVNIIELQNNLQEINNSQARTQKFIAVKTQQTAGRILVQGKNGSCFLSARILNKLLSSNKSPNRINNIFVRHHPCPTDFTIQISKESQSLE